MPLHMKLFQRLLLLKASDRCMVKSGRGVTLEELEVEIASAFDDSLTAKENMHRYPRVNSPYRHCIDNKTRHRFGPPVINMSSSAIRGTGDLTIELAHLASKGLDKKQTAEKFVLYRADPTSGRDSKTVVIIFAFYGASEKAIGNYCRLYHAYGFDTLIVPSYLKHFAWPNISLELATDLLNFVKKTCSAYPNIVIHAFSMGAYNFTLCMSEMYKAPELYSSIETKIKAVVYDSLTIGTLKNMAQGVGLGISKNSIVRTLVPLSMSLYFKLTSNYTVQVYEHYIDLFKQKPLQVPTLLFYCKNDAMSEYEVVHTLVEDWRKRFSFNIVDKFWEESKHSAHLLQHNEEYTRTVDSFLKCVPGLIKIDSKI